jgi:membrane glycosyltransferase
MDIAMVIVGKTLPGVKAVGGEILHPVNYATRSIVTLVLNPMRMALAPVKFVKHVFVVNAEWRGVKRDLAAEDASNMLLKFYWQIKRL